MTTITVKHRNTVYDLTSMQRDELLFLKIDIDSDIQAIKSQLKEAKNAVIEDGVYADKEWYRKATDASKILGSHSQKIQLFLSAIKKQEKTERMNSLSQIFMETAFQLLDADTYSRISAVAHDLMQQRQ